MKWFLRALGTFPGWLTASEDTNAPSTKDDPSESGGEPLVRSVRTYLAGEPHKIVVRVLPQSEPEPQLTDIHIVQNNNNADGVRTHSSDERSNGSVLKRNDLNNNPKDRLNARKSNEEDQGGPDGKPSETTNMPSAADRMQRQPLLTPNKQPSHVVVVDDSDQDQPNGLHQSGQFSNNADLPLSDLSGREDRYPKEVFKTFASLFFLMVCVTINMCSLALTHERVPDREKYGPLPDVFIDNVPVQNWGLDISEYIIMLTTSTATLILVMHKYRFIIIRRVFFITGLLYLYRSVTMYVTVLPMSNTSYYCSPKEKNITAGIIIKRMIYLMSGFGLSINGKHTYCGDFIYSGHTTILVLGYLVITEYSPRKLHLMHWGFFVSSLVGVFFLLLAHSHYMVDVVVAYYITTRLFWTYHSLTKHVSRQGGTNIMISREWWYRLFLYFECNVQGPVPRQYDWPLPWPKFLIKFFSRLS